MPTVSDDGRTYTFTIRSGYRFSPPSNEAVSAETFRYSIERAMSPALGADAPGAWSPRRHRLTRRRRRHVDDHTDGAVGRLPRATGGAVLLSVPLGTPAIPGGVAVPIDGVPGDTMAPSAGPYYVARWTNGDLTVLRRNPNYTGPRSHRFDAIVLREGIHPDVADELVASREWDGISDLFDRDGPVEDVFSDRLGCLTPLPDGVGVDLAAMCLAESA